MDEAEKVQAKEVGKYSYSSIAKVREFLSLTQKCLCICFPIQNICSFNSLLPPHTDMVQEKNSKLVMKQALGSLKSAQALCDGLKWD